MGVAFFSGGAGLREGEIRLLRRCEGWLEQDLGLERTSSSSHDGSAEPLGWVCEEPKLRQPGAREAAKELQERYRVQEEDP